MPSMTSVELGGSGHKATNPGIRESRNGNEHRQSETRGPCSIGTASDVRFVMVIYDRHTHTHTHTELREELSLCPGDAACQTSPPPGAPHACVE